MHRTIMLVVTAVGLTALGCGESAKPQPHSVVFLIGWVVLFYLWTFALGLPPGPDAPIYLP